MRSVEEKRCYGHQTQETPNSSAVYFEFHKGNNRTTLGKPTPSKWDDAQKWLVGLSSLSRGGEKNQSKNKPRNSNADDLRLIAPVPQKEQDFDEKDEEEEEQRQELATTSQHEAEETKKVECDESLWRINKPTSQNAESVRSICVRDMGTEMTPIASQEPSRTATPIRAMTPASRSPVHSGTSTPLRSSNGVSLENKKSYGAEESNLSKKMENPAKKLSPLESRALAWDEAERAKYMARFKREEVKIQAWENHQIRKAEMEIKRMEVKAERMKARAQEKLAMKAAATRREAEEKRANAEAKLNEKALRTSERADYIRRTGHVPPSFSFHFKFPSLCW
ncbi:hypothetical protein QN277_000430 [Acacia crassicarpa]|uniref:Remorin C-terminal domain-containing protein n=2 Tax=Acacia crassicarpa TaxID=499986 RepID=A0AAE1N7K5_9FABA|nr:hypothetical protein QN277_000430 [Acacia crassicarpa]